MTTTHAEQAAKPFRRILGRIFYSCPNPAACTMRHPCTDCAARSQA